MKARNKPKVYLAGGFRSGWQKMIRRQADDFEFLDPSTHNLDGPADYVAWDLDAIRRCDVVLANMEATNPGGYALALEIGYAKALGKLILLVEAHPDAIREKYFEMIRQVADLKFQFPDDAVSYLRQKYSANQS